jgi:hypothetical protein
VESPLQFLQKQEPDMMLLLEPGVVGKLHASAVAGAPQLEHLQWGAYAWALAIKSYQFYAVTCSFLGIGSKISA